MTHNVTDFSGTDHREPHANFAEIFDGKTFMYVNSTNSAIEDLLDMEGFHYEYEFFWEDQTRDLQEILGAMDELIDKVWYNRHMNRMYGIEGMRSRSCQRVLSAMGMMLGTVTSSKEHWHQRKR